MSPPSFALSCGGMALLSLRDLLAPARKDGQGCPRWVPSMLAQCSQWAGVPGRGCLACLHNAPVHLSLSLSVCHCSWGAPPTGQTCLKACSVFVFFNPLLGVVRGSGLASQLWAGKLLGSCELVDSGAGWAPGASDSTSAVPGNSKRNLGVALSLSLSLSVTCDV